jgi:hypothetical protein
VTPLPKAPPWTRDYPTLFFFRWHWRLAKQHGHFVSRQSAWYWLVKGNYFHSAYKCAKSAAGPTIDGSALSGLNYLQLTTNFGLRAKLDYRTGRKRKPFSPRLKPQIQRAIQMGFKSDDMFWHV